MRRPTMTSSLHPVRSDATRVRRRACFLGLAVALVATTAICAPHVPASDETVLAQVPVTSQSQRLRTLRRTLERNPTDLDAALELSRAWLDAGRREGDPRYFSYVQATLAPWTERRDAPIDTLILMATSLQSLHHFAEAQSLLERALQIDASNAQAWLTQATLLQVRGDFVAAASACKQLIGIADQTIALACVASAQSMQGKLENSYRALQRVVQKDADMDGSIRSWLIGQLGEMAVRLGDGGAAERHFADALLANPDDAYIKGELADLYLRQSRPDAVVALLKGTEAQDALLLRLAIAEKRLAGNRWASLYESRYRDALRDGDVTHSREHARYLLEVRGDAIAALQAAERNWQVQREPADIRIYWRAATAARSGSLDVVTHWIAENGYQDATLRART
jgi:tetratricopeptide (TPR) repeat protein